MAAARRHVFVEKVLKKLYTSAQRGQEKSLPGTPASLGPPEEEAAEKVACQSATLQADEGTSGCSTGTPPGKRLYTVSLPPEGFLPVQPELSCGPGSLSSSISEAEEEEEEEEEAVADQDHHDQPKRRRIRKRKSKKTSENHSGVPAEQTEFAEQPSLSWEILQPRNIGDGPALSRNKKRKLKKKRQMKRKKAAGLLTGQTSGVCFLYQPEEGSSEPEDAEKADGPDLELKVGTAAQEPELGLRPEVGPEAQEEGVSRTDKMADDILTFLKSTKEMYFYGGATRHSETSVSMESAAQLLKNLETHSLPCSDVLILDYMKSLVLLEDTTSLKHVLGMFPEHCLMPPDHVRVISAFFTYWITDILPQKNSSSRTIT